MTQYDYQTLQYQLEAAKKKQQEASREMVKNIIVALSSVIVIALGIFGLVKVVSGFQGALISFIREKALSAFAGIFLIVLGVVLIAVFLYKYVENHKEYNLWKNEVMHLESQMQAMIRGY